jgi:hypothetical protein
MNRKLRNTILAFSVTGMLLVAGLMVATPVPSDAAAPTPGLAQDSQATPAPLHDGPLLPLAGGPSLVHGDPALASRIDAHVRQFEAGVGRDASIETVVAASTGLLAAVTAEAVLARAAGRARAGRPCPRTAETPQQPCPQRDRGSLFLVRSRDGPRRPELKP